MTGEMAVETADTLWAWSKHAALRQTDRQVPPQQVEAALQHPTTTKPMPDGCVLYARGAVYVVANPRDHTIISCWYRWKDERWNH